MRFAMFVIGSDVTVGREGPGVPQTDSCRRTGEDGGVSLGERDLRVVARITG